MSKPIKKYTWAPSAKHPTSLYRNMYPFMHVSFISIQGMIIIKNSYWSGQCASCTNCLYFLHSIKYQGMEVYQVMPVIH